MRNKSCFIIAIILLFLSEGIKAQIVIQLLDEDSAFAIPFFLEYDTIIKKSDEEAKLILTAEELNILANKKFKIDFLDVEDCVIYRNRLYFIRGTNKRDDHLSFSSVKLGALCTQPYNVFFTRLKESGIEDR